MAAKKKFSWPAPRKILHVDMDAFYAAIEQRDHPELRGKAVIVGGTPNGRGVVSTASYEARKFGVRSAMPAFEAKKLCPDGIFLRPHFEKYEAASHTIHSILRKYTAKVESVGMDEAYLDVTVNVLKIEDPAEVASLIKQNIKAATRLTASAGVAPNKFLAKIASDMQKPDGLTVVHPDQVLSFLHPLAVRKIPGVGPVTEKKLLEAGLPTCGDIFEKSQRELLGLFGKFGLELYAMARGIDESSVTVFSPPKQVGSEETFDRDLLQKPLLEQKIKELALSTAERLKMENKRGRTVTLKVKYADFEVITRAKTLSQPTENPSEIAREAILLLRTKTEAGKKKIRLLGVSVSHFEDQERRTGQLELFSSEILSQSSRPTAARETTARSGKA